MRILIYGFNNRTSRLIPSSNYVKFITLLDAAFRSMGHQVVVGVPPEGISAEGLNAYDKVFIGMGSPTSFASETVYEGLYIINKLRGTEKLVLMFDDPDIRKVMYGMGYWIKNPSPENIFRSAYRKRRLWYDPTTHAEDARRWTDWHVETCRFLLGYLSEDPYPPVLLPLFKWGSVQNHRMVFPTQARDQVRSVDLTALISVTDKDVIEPRERIWVADQLRKDTTKTRHDWLMMQHTAFPVHALRPKASDSERITAFKKSWGVLQHPLTPYGGWWSTTMAYALLSRTLFLSDPDTLTELGPTFNLLAAGTEHLSDEERLELADQQRASFTQNIAPKDEIRQCLQEVLSNV